MSQYVVWLDSEKAHIFNLKFTGIEKSHLEKKVFDHHTQNEHNRHTDSAGDHFFKELASKLIDAKELLILGPGMAKKSFKSYLEKHHHLDLAKSIVGLENSDHPTDNQILASARKFFVKYDVFNRPV